MSVWRLCFGLLAAGRARHPLLFGAAEGLVAMVAVGFALGLAGRAAAVPAWPVLLWAALAFHRSLRYQVTAAVVLGVGTDFLSGGAFGAGIGALAGALAVANIFDSPIDERWSAGHAVFALAAVGGGWLTGLLLAAAGPPGFGPAPGFGPLALSVAVIVFAVFVGVLLHVARERRRMRESALGLGGKRRGGALAASGWMRQGRARL